MDTKIKGGENMVVKIDPEKILENYKYSCIDQICNTCKTEKPIPAVRQEPICDDCIDKIQAKTKAEDEARELKRRLVSMRIPERYKYFDITKLEISREDFLDYGKPGKSLAIIGEVGTGKTNLACQILIQRGTGLFYTAVELASPKLDLDRLADTSNLVIDDISKLDATNEKRMEKIFDFLNYRYRECKDTIVTFDKPADELKEYFGEFGEAMVSRFKSWMFNIQLYKKWR